MEAERRGGQCDAGAGAVRFCRWEKGMSLGAGVGMVW